MNASHLTRGVAQDGWTKASSSPETSPKFAIDHELLQSGSKSRLVTSGREHATRRIHNLARTTDAAGDNRQTGLQRFDQRDPKRFWRSIGLAEHVGRSEQRGHIGPLTEEA